MFSKTCSKCKKDKELKEFSIDKRAKTGTQSACKLCSLSYRNKNTLKIKETNRLRYIEKREYILKQSKKWAKNNPKKVTAKSNRRRAAKLNAILPGITCNIVYLLCPKGYHVDHIIPLQGKNVCGLHVPWNLQYLTPEENFKKGNSYVETTLY